MKLLIILFVFALLPTELIYSQNAWQLQFYDSTNSLSNLYFFNEYTGWAVGFHGRIANTTNGGDFWNSQISGTSQELFSVYFLNPDTGFIGGRGLILMTKNSGLNWEIINIDTLIEKKVIEFREIYFTSKDTVYLLGVLIEGGNDFFWERWLFLKSYDGLKHFEIENIGINYVAVTKYYNLYFPNRKFFHDAKTGYKLNGFGLLKTFDDGLTWKAIGSFIAVYFVNSNVGYAIVNHGYGYDSGHMLIIKTTTGGE